MTARYALPLMLLLGLLLWFVMPSSAQASDRFWFGVNFGGVQPRVERTWVPETYVTRTENVLVAPAHYEDRWVPPVYETRYQHGRPYTVTLREGYTQRVLVPARYEVRAVRQCVPGYWCEAPVATCGPSVFLGSSFARAPIGRFDNRRDDHRYDRYRRNDGARGHAGLNIRF